jgi:hypothetical protein
MAHNFPSSKSNSTDTWFILESQIRECYGRVAYSHKAHEKNADIYLIQLRCTKFFQIILSAITTGGIFGVLFSNGSEILAIITATTATIQFFLNTYIKEYSLSEAAERHSVTASKLWSVRESYLSLLTDIASREASIEQVTERRDHLQEDLALIYEKAPRTIPQAYKAAQKGLKLNEELTFSDEEIDVFLPKPLRRK